MESRRDRLGRIGQGGLEPWEQVAGTDRDEDAQLSQQPSDGVDAGGTGGDPTGAEAVEAGEGLLMEGLDRDKVRSARFDELRAGPWRRLGPTCPEGRSGACGAGAAAGHGGRATPVVGPCAGRSHRPPAGTVAGGWLRKKGSSWARDKRLRRQTRPGCLETATSKTLFARSTAMVICFSTDSSFQEMRCSE
jgi:hypothetical protein